MKRRQFLAAAFAMTLAPMTLSSCSLISGDQKTASGGSGAFPSTWEKTITIDVFDDLANFQGTQNGWFAKVVKDKFNMKLNMIAPNVTGGGETLFNTRSAAGSLGDLVVVGSADHYDKAVKGGLFLDASKYYKQMSSLKKHDAAVQHLNSPNKGKVYAFPTSLSSLKATQSSEGLEPTFGPYLRWDLYAKLGYPKIDTLDDLLPVLKKMQDLEPTAPNGKKVYAISLFKDWDGNMMNNAKQPACFYGFDEVGFVLAKADGASYESIVDSDSHYVASLRFFEKANKLGLVDPDSSTQDYSTLYSKYQNGQVLFSFWPWLGQAAYNTEANTAAGKGFEIVPMKDQKIFSYGATVFGSGTYTIGIGSQAKDPQRVAAFIDWLYSSEGAYSNGSQTGAAAGPKGLTWKMPGKTPELTAFGEKVFIGGGDVTVPDAWGGGVYSKGVSALNVTTILPVDTDPGTGYPYSYQMWPSYQKLTSTPLTKDWSKHMGGAASTMDYLRAKKQILVAPGSSYTAPTDSAEIATLRAQIKTIIVQDSWKMALATSDSEFESNLKHMQDTVDGLGYAKVLKVDMQHAKAQNTDRVAVAKKFG